MSGKPYPTAPAMSYPQQYSVPGPADYTAPAPGGYPAQPYPQSTYPGYPPQGQPYGAPTGYPGGPGAPPPYTAVQQHGPPPPYTAYSQPASQPTSVPMPQPQTVYMPGAFDSGARFDGVAQPRIPPPPPGVAPHPAQLASMQGHNVQTTQQRSDWFTGGNGGGFTWGGIF